MSRLATEIGCHEGYTTRALAREAAVWGARVIAIDPWEGNQDSAGPECYERFLAYTKAERESGSLVVCRQRSQDAPDVPAGFVFHDGDHRADPQLERWFGNLSPGGVLALHDTHDPGWPVVRAFAEIFEPPVGRHEYRYTPTEAERAEYGPGLRGLMWWVKS
jgi:predicted O-methyltransferase YrrM